ncbi:unnamed protein product [Symbiodinium pilosum]|uniref:EF-hand domain-containing protein n=1 Tax=Symbiodinium pilosum TaxID=2952 RepID=A0A812JTI3_SYMPI|nr:unnamed protein product [Symbiodinium pilosum]
MAQVHRPECKYGLPWFGRSPQVLRCATCQEILAVDTAEAVQPLLQGTTISERTLQEAFKQCDANQDNFVTRIELIKACKSHPEIAQMLGVPEDLRDSARAQFEQVRLG